MEYNHIAVYDVLQEYKKIRPKIVQELLDSGMDRIQYSVFGGNLTKEELENLIVRLKNLKADKKADIRIFLLGRTHNKKRIITVSEASPPHPSTNENKKQVMVF